MSTQATKEVEIMTLAELSFESLQLKQKLEKKPNDFMLTDRLNKVTIERKKKKLQNLLKDLELGGVSFFYIRPEINALKAELTNLGINVAMLEAAFIRQSLYI